MSGLNGANGEDRRTRAVVLHPYLKSGNNAGRAVDSRLEEAVEEREKALAEVSTLRGRVAELQATQVQLVGISLIFSKMLKNLNFLKMFSSKSRCMEY